MTLIGESFRTLPLAHRHMLDLAESGADGKSTWMVRLKLWKGHSASTPWSVSHSSFGRTDWVTQRPTDMAKGASNVKQFPVTLRERVFIARLDHRDGRVRPAHHRDHLSMSFWRLSRVGWRQPCQRRGRRDLPWRLAGRDTPFERSQVAFRLRLSGIPLAKGRLR